jgi:hypothetical protein
MRKMEVGHPRKTKIERRQNTLNHKSTQISPIIDAGKNRIIFLGSEPDLMGYSITIYKN